MDSIGFMCSMFPNYLNILFLICELLALSPWGANRIFPIISSVFPDETV